MVRGKEKRYGWFVCIGIMLLLLLSLFFVDSMNAQALDESKKGDTGTPITKEIEAQLTDVKYIPNADYFQANPQHKNSNQTGYENGACTTIAMQMLLGYHNYYSDRRLIPEVNENGERFLAENYADLREHPIVQPQKTYGQGRASIGTENSVFDALIELLDKHDTETLDQTVMNVEDGAERFVKKYAPQIEDTVTISWGGFRVTDLWADIAAGRPILVGFNPIGTGATTFHVVPVYGYATYKGKKGLIAHWGWGDQYVYNWFDMEWAGFEIRMSVNHTHTLKDTGRYAADAYREYACTTCGYTTVDCIYDITDNTITGIKYPLAEDVVIPTVTNKIPITAIGDGVFAGKEIHSVELPWNIQHIGENAFADCPQLNSVENVYNLQTIGANAFANCPQLSSIPNAYNLQSIGANAFFDCWNLQNFYLSSTLSAIGERAFAGCTDLRISASSYNSQYAAQDNIIYNKDKTAILHTGKTDANLIIPDTVTEIAAHAFEKNGNVLSVRIKGTPTVGKRAFAECVNLSAVHFESHRVPDMGAEAFTTAGLPVYVPYPAQSAYASALSACPVAVQSVPVSVYFISDGIVTGETTVYTGAEVGDLPQPEKEGYTFGGWYDTAACTGDAYVSTDVWNTEDPVNLYAEWIPKQYEITLDANGGDSEGGNTVTVAYGTTFSLPVPVKEGYAFDGWFTAPNGIAEPYTTETGASTRAWDIAANTTLYAQWTVKEYEIRINNDGTVTWLGTDGLSDDPSYIQYGAVIDFNDLVPAYKQSAQGFKTGKIFDRFEYKDGPLDWTSVPDLGENGAIAIIIPIWKLEEHTIRFYTSCDIEIAPLVADYGMPITLPSVPRLGYAFNGWYTAPSGGARAQWPTMPDFTPNDQNNGSVMLYARFTANTYRIVYNANGGTGASVSVMHTYDKPQNLRANTFTRTGHDFTGWATAKGGTAQYANTASVVNLTAKQDESITLYAVWEAQRFSIIYRNLMPNMYVDYVYFVYGEGLPTMSALYYQSDVGTSKLDDFYGWYTSAAFTTRVTSISPTQIGDVIVYAKYDYYIGPIWQFDTQTVTDDGVMKQPYVDVPVFLGRGLYDEVKDTTLSKIRITFSLNIWKVDDGYQHLLLYNGDTVVWSHKMDHANGKNSTRYTFTIELDLATYKDVDAFVLRFSASGNFSDDWRFNQLEIYRYLVN